MPRDTLSATIGGLARMGVAEDDPRMVDARREHKADRAARHLEEVLGRAPKLTEAQLDRLCAIIRGAR